MDLKTLLDQQESLRFSWWDSSQTKSNLIRLKLSLTKANWKLLQVTTWMEIQDMGLLWGEAHLILEVQVLSKLFQIREVLLLEVKDSDNFLPLTLVQCNRPTARVEIQIRIMWPLEAVKVLEVLLQMVLRKMPINQWLNL